MNKKIKSNPVKPVYGNGARRIGIDARFYGPESKGLGRYTKELVDNVLQQDQENEYVVFLRQENFNSFNTDNPRVKKVLSDIRWYTLKEQIIFPWLIWREKLDFIHFTHFNVPILTPIKFIITIHDLILTKHPTARASTLSPILYWIKNLAYRVTIYVAAKRAKIIIAISEFTRQDIIKKFKVDKSKVKMVYEGVATSLIKDKKTDDKKVILGYNIHRPYLLYVGNAYPHKNLEGLIRIFPKIKEKFLDLKLVLVGKKDYFYTRLSALVKDTRQENSIIFPGFVPDNDLISFYKLSEAYVFPSFFEGFGLPPLEAMQHSCPVTSSNATCLPEVLGEAAVYFDPRNTGEMVKQIIRILEDTKLQSQLKEKGLRQIKKYSWQKCAKETLDIYSQI